MLFLTLWLATVSAGSNGDMDEAELRALAAPLEASGDEGSLRRLVDEMLPRVAAVMRANRPRNFTLRIVSRTEAAAKLQEVLKREYPGDQLDRLSQALQAVHLVSPGTNLAREAAELYGKNVGGFYDAHDKSLYLLKDQPMMSQMMIVPHELAHAIQDDRMNLGRAMNDRHSSEDATLALSAAVEGNAQAVGSAVLAEAAESGQGAEGNESAGMLAMLSESIGDSAQAAAQQSEASPWLGLQMHFPYSAGMQLVNAAREKGDRNGMQLLVRPPESTAQVVDPTLYFREEHPLTAKRMNLAQVLGANRVIYETTLGRANLDLFGEIHADGATLGEGWRGDRLESVTVKGKLVTGWAVAFAKPAQAQRFAQAYAHIIEAKPKEAGRFVGDTASVRWQGTVVAISEGAQGDIQAFIETAGLQAFPESGR